jgi:hypothetical protein
MKLIHFFWSLLILAILIYIPSLFYRTNAKLHGGTDLYAFYFILWTITSILSPILLILSKVRVIREKMPFTQTLLLVFNLYFAIHGMYLVLTGEIAKDRLPIFLLFFLNVLWAVLFILLRASKAHKNQTT